MENGMTLDQLNAFNVRMADPEAALVAHISKGGKLDDRGRKNAEDHIKVIEGRIESKKDFFESQFFNQPKYPQSKDGEKILARIAEYESWIKTIKKAIGLQEKAERKEEKKNLTNDVEKFTRMARESQEKLEGSKQLVSEVIKLGKMLDGALLREKIEPVLEARKRYRIAYNNIQRLRGEGVKDLPHLMKPLEDGLEEAFEKLTIQIKFPKFRGGRVLK